MIFPLINADIKYRFGHFQILNNVENNYKLSSSEQGLYSPDEAMSITVFYAAAIEDRMTIFICLKLHDALFMHDLSKHRQSVGDSCYQDWTSSI